MARTPLLTRLQSLLYPLVQQNNVSDAMLMGPAESLGTIEASVDLLANDGRGFQPGTVTIGANLTTLTQSAAVDRVEPNGTVIYKALVDWTTQFRAGDEVVLGGSVLGNNAIRTIATVSATTMTVTAPFTAAEAELFYAKPTKALLRRCRELLLFPGGYETDTELRALLEDWIPTMQQRGSLLGTTTEMNRVTNSTSTSVLQTLPDLAALGTGVSYTHSTKILTGGTWTSLDAGEAVTVVGSTKDSDGRYTVYDRSGSNLVLGHRAARSTHYPRHLVAGMTELQFKEDRALGLLKVRLLNTAGTSQTVAFTVTVTGATAGATTLLAGTGTASVAGGVVTASLTAAGASQASPAASELSLALTGLSATSTFQVAVTSGTPTAVRVGELGLSISGLTLWPWRWGGVVRTGLRSQMNETGLTVYILARPGFYLGVGSPSSIEEDAYTMASPDEFVVVEVDHRNPTNYTEQDLKALVREVLLPADVDGVLGLL